MKNLFLVLIFVFAIACQKSESTPVTQTAVDPTTSQAVTQAKGSHDGVYVFDAPKYKEEQLKYEDSLLKDMNPEDVEKMLKVFQPFKIEVAGDMATASFSQDVIQGTLKTLVNTADETRFMMTPIDEDKKDETVTLIIKKDLLVLDPGKKETDKMFFKKAN